jgi:TRAP-type uncharacterized transport system substrate-binding protein
LARNHYWRAAAAIALAAIAMLSNMPPRMILMATGPEGGAYYELGKRYRAELENEGVKVQLVPTAGSLENRGLLLDRYSKVSGALMQGGTMSTGDSSELASLGTLFYEPLWWFRRREIHVEGVSVSSAKSYRLDPRVAGHARYRLN